jgi:hypothetical protein
MISIASEPFRAVKGGKMCTLRKCSDGENRSLAELAAIAGVSNSVLYIRLRKYDPLAEENKDILYPSFIDRKMEENRVRQSMAYGANKLLGSGKPRSHNLAKIPKPTELEEKLWSR